MNRPIDYQIIEQNGKPAFAVMPYDDFIALLNEQGEDTYLPDDIVRMNIPDDIVRMNILEGMSLPRAWREYKGLTQAQVATKLGISQPAMAQMERPDANLRIKTLNKLADVLEITVEQLTS
jgi:DNA-binding XRE family transcriptional regulator